MKRGDDSVLEGWQIIGWNPVDECIRSWTFDDEGGFTEGRWTRDGERWLVREIGYGADGSRTRPTTPSPKPARTSFSGNPATARSTAIRSRASAASKSTG